MERIAFINGDTFIYWSPIILALAAVTAILFYAAFFLKKDGDLVAMGISILVSVALSIPLSRLVHWYCRSANYDSFSAAMTDYSNGGYALLGVFFACMIATGLLRLLRISRNLPRMLDCMAIGGGVGIAVGRLASMFNASDRGMILSEEIGFPFASTIVNAVSGAQENRLATFMIQSMLTGGIVVLLLLYMAWRALRRKKNPDGDIFLLFLLAYGASQAICDSTRYDSLFLRSNGFVSVVQIAGLIGLLIPIVVFSVRMVLRFRLRIWQFPLWVAILGLLGTAGYMEYYVQRHGNEAYFAYSLMGLCLMLVVLLGLVVRTIGNWPVKKKAEAKKEAVKV